MGRLKLKQPVFGVMPFGLGAQSRPSRIVRESYVLVSEGEKPPKGRKVMVIDKDGKRKA